MDNKTLIQELSKYPEDAIIHVVVRDADDYLEVGDIATDGVGAVEIVTQ